MVRHVIPIIVLVIAALTSTQVVAADRPSEFDRPASLALAQLNPASTDNEDRGPQDKSTPANTDRQSANSNRTPRTLLFPLALYSLIIAAASLFGGWLPGRFRMSHLRFQLLLSVIGGLLLGIGIFHLLVHSVHELGAAQIDLVAVWMMAGVLLMFFLLRAFHVHHHDTEFDFDPAQSATITDSHQTAAAPAQNDASDAHSHAHDSSPAEHASCGHIHGDHPHSRLSWTGLLFGLSVHTLLDGFALGAAMQADADHNSSTFVAIGILLGIVLHKPLDSLSITTMMLKAHFNQRSIWTVNIVYALLCPLAATLFLVGVSQLDAGATTFVGCSLAFSAGIFICIALADLLPEMEFHTHDRWRLSIALLVGILIAWAIQFLEPARLHG